jgi:hypothetical protein
LTSKKREVCNGLLNVLGWSQGDIAGHKMGLDQYKKIQNGT